MTDITPAVSAGLQIVESYGGMRFRVSGAAYGGSVLVFPDRTLSWPVARIEDLSLDSLGPVVEAAAEIEILLLGCGARMAPVAPDLRAALRAHGFVLEPMDTGAACRTYNVLAAEARRVAAALIAVE